MTEFIAKGRATSRHIHLFDITFAFLQIYTKGIGSFTREVNLDLTSTTSTTNLIILLAYQMCSTQPTNHSDTLKFAITLWYWQWKSNLNLATIEGEGHRKCRIFIYIFIYFQVVKEPLPFVHF